MTNRMLAVACLIVLNASTSMAAPVNLVADDFSTWQGDAGQWQIVGNALKSPENEKLLTSTPGKGVLVNGATGKTAHLVSKAEFGDVKAHVEFMVPKGSNSGVYFMGRYEIQVFDSWGITEPKYSDCGGIYQGWDEKEHPQGFEGRAPRVNASLEPGKWQVYDVVFRAPRFDASGKKIANARFDSVTLNGHLIHDKVEVTSPTRASLFEDEKPTGPMMFQGDHGPVAYRNIQIEPLTGRK